MFMRAGDDAVSRKKLRELHDFKRHTFVANYSSATAEQKYLMVENVRLKFKGELTEVTDHVWLQRYPAFIEVWPLEVGDEVEFSARVNVYRRNPTQTGVVTVDYGLEDIHQVRHFDPVKNVAVQQKKQHERTQQTKMSLLHDQKKHHFVANYVHVSHNNKKYVAVAHVKADGKNEVVADQIWMERIAEFYRLEQLQRGDEVEFDAFVAPYLRGYRGKHQDQRVTNSRENVTAYGFEKIAHLQYTAIQDVIKQGQRKTSHPQ